MTSDIENNYNARRQTRSALFPIGAHRPRLVRSTPYKAQ